MKLSQSFKKKIVSLAAVTALFTAAPSFAAFDVAAYYGIGSVDIETTTGNTTVNSNGWDVNRIGGWADVTFELPVPVVNFFIGFGVFFDQTSLSLASADSGVTSFGGQGIIGAGLFDLTLFLRPGFGLALGENDFTGSLFQFNLGLMYNIFAIVDLFVELSLPTYSMSSGSSDSTTTGSSFNFGVRLGF